MKKENEIISREAELVGSDNSAGIYQTASVFMGINIAVLRQKQLKQSAHSRLINDSLKHKNTIIAIEEVKQGLVAFKFVEDPIV